MGNFRDDLWFRCRKGLRKCEADSTVLRSRRGSARLKALTKLAQHAETKDKPCFITENSHEAVLLTQIITMKSDPFTRGVNLQSVPIIWTEGLRMEGVCSMLSPLKQICDFWKHK